MIPQTKFGMVFKDLDFSRSTSSRGTNPLLCISRPDFEGSPELDGKEKGVERSPEEDCQALVRSVAPFPFPAGSPSRPPRRCFPELPGVARVKAAGPPRRLPRPGARAAGGGAGAESRGSPARPLRGALPAPLYL